MGEVVYTSKIRIEQDVRPLRRAYLPMKEEPVRFGVHGAVREHYGADPEQQDPTTLDYVIAAAAG